MKTVKLKIALICWEEEIVWRVIEIPENKTLHQLHLFIQKTFGWYNDHIYSFFMDNKRWSRKSEYTSPIEAEGDSFMATGIKLKDFNLSLKQKFLYLYDFGDNLDHEIEVAGFGETDKAHKYPQLVGAFGAVPEQYAIRRFEKKNEDDFSEEKN